MSEEHYFGLGFIIGMLAMFVLVFAIALNKKTNEESGYTDKMVISYHCPDKEYERQRFREVVYGTGIQTNFANLETSMDKHWIRIRMTNPKKDK